MNKEKRKGNNDDGLDNDEGTDINQETERHVKCKIKHEQYNAALSEPTPDGIKRYIYHEHIQRIIEAPKESRIYSEQQLQTLLTEALSIYQMLYFIRNKNKRICFISDFLQRLWHMEVFGNRDHWKASRSFFVFYCFPCFDEDAFETKLRQLLEKTKHENIDKNDNYLRLKVLLDIFNKINTSQVQRDI
jgi:hypothetical protein